MRAAAAPAHGQRLWQRVLPIRYANLSFRSQQLRGANADVPAAHVASHYLARAMPANSPVSQTANRDVNSLLQSSAPSGRWPALALGRRPAKATRVSTSRAKLVRTREQSHLPTLPVATAQQGGLIAIASSLNLASLPRYARTRLSPRRRVTPCRSSFSRNGTMIRRELSSASRSSLTVAGPFLEMKLAIAFFMRSKFSRDNTTSEAISITSPPSIKNLRTRSAFRSDSISLRAGGSNGFFDSASRIFAAAGCSVAGNAGRCERRAIIDSFRTKSFEHMSSMSASKTCPA